MSASLPSTANAEPNLTPMLDMVFQLVTFFMLVINFKSSALDLNLKLPVVGSARMVDAAARDLIVLNLTAHGALRRRQRSGRRRRVPAPGSRNQPAGRE